MATIIYYANLDYDKLPTAKRRKSSSEGPGRPYVNPAYSDSAHTLGSQQQSDFGTSNGSSSFTPSNGSSSFTPPNQVVSPNATIQYYQDTSQENAQKTRPRLSSQENVVNWSTAHSRQLPTPTYHSNSISNSNHSKKTNNNYAANNRRPNGLNQTRANGKRPYNQMDFGPDGGGEDNDDDDCIIEKAFVKADQYKPDRAPSFRHSRPQGPRVHSSRPPDSKTLHETLLRYFKFSAFRENQLESINATCHGCDTLVLMPTGGGKSICYQLPAILSDGLTIVVSPLKSLISDQVNRMQSLNVKTSALFGETKENEAESIYHDLRQDWPEHKLLYVTPEKINASNFLISVFIRLYERNLLARFVIDEAHCVSSWGADFRPDYRKLGKLRDLFPKVPIMALTATAPPKVRDDILDQLGMDKLTARVFIQSFNRPNLKFEVRDKSKGCLVEICQMIRANFKRQCGIIYCLSRVDCKQVADKLRENGISSAPYHAGLTDETRQNVFAAWSRGTFQVVCATIAFGMGIDKSDVRFVFHYSMPKSIEGYYQEAGRAGRDNKTANCILYFSRSDLYRMKSMLSKTGFGRKAEDKRRDVGNLQHMIDYVENKTECRRAILLRYLGEEFNSDECVKRADTVCDNCYRKIPRLR